MNPIFNQMQNNGPAGNLTKIMQQVNQMMNQFQKNPYDTVQQFRNQIQMNPQQIVMQLMNSGQMTQEQFNELSNMANQFMSMSGKPQ